MKNIDLEQKIRESLLQLLGRVPVVHDLEYILDESESGADFTIDVVTDHQTFRLVVGVRNNGQPRYARETVALLKMQSSGPPDNIYPVFAAPFISKAAAEICLEAGAGCIDLVGNCRLAFNGIYIEQQGRPNRFVSKRSLRSLYETRSSRVLRALLFDPALRWKLTDLSEAAGVSIGQVYNVKKALIDREWALVDKDGLSLTQPAQILRDWGNHYTLDKNTLFGFHTTESPADVENSLARAFSKLGLRYALTSFSASVRLASNGQYSHVYAYGDGDVQRAADLAKLEASNSTPNVTLMLPHDEGVFFGMKQMEGAIVVSPIQAYLDLVGLEAEGAEAAENLFSQVIEKEWPPA